MVIFVQRLDTSTGFSLFLDRVLTRAIDYSNARVNEQHVEA